MPRVVIPFHTTTGQSILCYHGGLIHVTFDEQTYAMTVVNNSAPVAIVDAALRKEQALQSLPFELIDIIAQYTEACIH